MSIQDRAAQLSEQASNFFKISAASGMAGIGLNDILQTVALVVTITTGVMAIRHYHLSIKLKQLDLEDRRPEETKKAEGWD